MVATEEGGGGGGGRASRRKSGKPERYKDEDEDGDTAAAKRSPPKSAAAAAASPAVSSAKKKNPAAKIKIEGGGGGIKIDEGGGGGENGGGGEETATAPQPQPQRASGRIRIKLRNGAGGDDDGPARGVGGGGGDIPPTNGVKPEVGGGTRSGKRGREGGVVAAAEDEGDDREDDGDGGGGALSRKPTAAKTVKVRVRLDGDDPPPQCPPDGTLYAELDAAVVPRAAGGGEIRDDDDYDDDDDDDDDDGTTGAGDNAEAAGGGGRGGGGERTIEEDGGEGEESPPPVVEGPDGAREAADGAASSLSAVAAKAEEEEEEEEEDLAREGAGAPLAPPPPSSEQLLQSKLLSRGKYCAYESCTRYRQTGCYGYCLTHRHLSDPALHAHRREVANAQSCEKKRTMKNRSNLCKWPDCLKYIQSNCHGYCLTHVKYADYMGSSGGGGVGEGEFGGGMMGGGAEDTADYDDDLLYEVTKVRVRVQQRLQNGFCRAILPMELRDKWGFVRGGGEEDWEEEDYGINSGMPGREDDYDEYSEDDGKRRMMLLGKGHESKGNVDENDDDEPTFAAADATTAALPGTDGDLHDENGVIDAPKQRIDGEDAEPGRRAADADDAAAASRSSGKKFSDDTLDFPVSSTPVKKSNGSLKCRAVSCPKNCQGNSDGFCRAHHNQYLICTGQCDSWVCICGNKIVDFMARCGACHRWRGGKHPLSSSLPAAKRLKNNAGAAVEMAGGQAGTVDDVGGIRSSLTYVPPDAAAQISEKQLTNGSGRALCKVIGCGKLDQSNNDGFCRTHFNMFAVEGADSDLDGWTCVCGQSMSGKQKRCGNCNKWRGGKRDAYETNKGGFSEESIIYDENDGEPWKCDCGNVVPAAKSRCGSCHHWRGGKRQGGWKLGSIGRDYDSDDGVDRTQEWTCCGTAIPAQQTRCGKCNGWRGGKRIAGGASAALTVASNLPPWVCIKCHISNPGNKRRCGGCLVWKTTVQSSKSSKPSKPRASFGDAIFMGEGGSTSGGHWQCKKCNFDNFASELECFVCQSMRPNYQWHKKQQIINSSTPVPTTQNGAAMTAVVTVTPQPSLPASYAVLAAGTATSSQLPPPGLAAGGKPTLPVAAQGATSNIGSGKNQLTSTNLVAVSMNKQGAATAPTPGNSGNVVADSISRPPDNLNYYGTYNEDLGYPYISIHYDFNRAYYHNHDYTYLNASAARSSCGSSNSHGGDCK